MFAEGKNKRFETKTLFALLKIKYNRNISYKKQKRPAINLTIITDLR